MNSDLIINNNEGILEITFNRPERKNAISEKCLKNTGNFKTKYSSQRS